MSDILERILRVKAEEVAKAKDELPESALLAQIEERRQQPGQSPRGFLHAIRTKHQKGLPAVISEIKRASPSKGILRDPYDPAAIAQEYEAAGAACLSVLTDHDFFQGEPAHLVSARAACGIPVLRKDFIVDAYQVLQARSWGADCILLIAAALSDAQMQSFEELALAHGMDVLIEVHDREELGRALRCKSPLIGINNRNLRTFETRLETTLDMLPMVPQDRILVTESGILSRPDVQRMRDAGVHTFLVGEAFMRAERPGRQLQELFFPGHPPQ
jgi:indole-3-glycerol phosphate synthase